MYFNGSYTLKRARAGVVVIPPEGDILKYDIQLNFPTTNKIAEYEGLVTGLRLAKELSIRRLLIRGDSQLMRNKCRKNMIVTVIRWQNTWQKCKGWRSYLMSLKYDMSHA
jgi:ribonuclease HI